MIEDTKYTYEDIESIFGIKVASLVMGASEPDKSLSWRERKEHTIRETKHLPLENKLVICADKINNLESLIQTFEKTGKRDFSAFKEGEDSQRWYYTEVYHSLVDKEDKDLPIFKRLEEVLQLAFEKKEDTFVRDTIFEGKEELYQNLKRFHAYKQELLSIRNLCEHAKPYVIEFSGTPRSGKTNIMKNLEEFFKKGGFKVSYLQEFMTLERYKELAKTSWKNFSQYERMMNIEMEVFKILHSELEKNLDIILIDRALNDRIIWDHRRYLLGNYDESHYQKLREKYLDWMRENINCLVLFYTDSLTALKRDYLSSLCLEPRRFQSIENLNSYNNSLITLRKDLERNTESNLWIDTSKETQENVTIELMNGLMPLMRTRYIADFKKEYHIK